MPPCFLSEIPTLDRTPRRSTPTCLTPVRIQTKSGESPAQCAPASHRGHAEHRPSTRPATHLLHRLWWNVVGFYCFFSPPGTRASWLRTPWRWVDTSRWWRPSPPTRECFETNPLRPNVSRTTSRAGESHGGLKRGLRPNPPCLRFSAISGWCPPWRCLLLTPSSRWLSSTSTGLHGSLHLTDEVLEKSQNVLQIIHSYDKNNNNNKKDTPLAWMWPGCY